MNSAQRRRMERRFRHVVVLQIAHDQQYHDWDDHLYTARDWLDRTIGRDSYRYHSKWIKATFFFVREQDAVVFTLRLA